MRVHLDFETRSRADIKATGAWRYSADESTEPLCLAYRIDAQPIQLITRQAFLRWMEDGTMTPELKELRWLAGNFSVVFVAHNAFFEQCIWRNVMRRFGMPDIPIRRWRCTAAKASAYGLPRALKKVAEALELPLEKDEEGHKAMLKLSKPRRPSKNNPSEWHEDPHVYEQLYFYCKRDVEVERLIDETLKDLNATEQEVWFLDQRINSNGVHIDRHAVLRTLDLIADTQEALREEFKDLTEGYVGSPSQVAVLQDWLRGQGYDMPDLKATTVDRQLRREDLSPTIRRILEIRRQLSKISTSKYESLLSRLNPDDRLRDLFIYHGATTGRWAGAGVQVHNLPRGSVNSDVAINCMMDLDREGLEFLYPNLMEVYSSCIRGMFTAQKDCSLVAADFSAIEARGLAWLADQQDVLDVFREGKDPYCAEASKIYGKPINKKEHPNERQVGKVCILAFGYQGGIGAMDTMARGYGLNLVPVYENLWPSTTDDERARAYTSQELYEKRCDENQVPSYLRLSDRSALIADILKQRWRSANQHTVAFWNELEQSAIQAVLTGQPVQCGKLIWFTHKDFLHCKLPSGRCLGYHKPRVKESTTPWGATKNSLSYMTLGTRNIYSRRISYGGLLAENVTQAVCRDVLADAMLRFSEQGYEIVLHVHDELVLEVPTELVNLKRFEEDMSKPPQWAVDFPIKAEGWVGKRYRK